MHGRVLYIVCLQECDIYILCTGGCYILFVHGGVLYIVCAREGAIWFVHGSVLSTGVQWDIVSEQWYASSEHCIIISRPLLLTSLLILSGQLLSQSLTLPTHDIPHAYSFPPNVGS